MNGIFTKKIFNFIFVMAVMSAMIGCGTHPNDATVTERTGSALKNKTETVEETEAAEDSEETEVTIEDMNLYIVESLNMTDETISLYSLTEDKQFRYSYNMTTKFLDKYGDNTLWASFTTGTVVTIGDLLPSSGALSQVQKSGDVWIYEDISKYDLQPDNNLIQIDGSNYKITDSTKVYSDTEKILPTSIGTEDVITVIGKDKEVISIAVTTGHGYIHLTNTSLFDNSMIFIGKKIVSMVSGDEIIEVPEGDYEVTVANNGWGGTGEYTVNRNETTEINLEDLKGEGPSFCLITFLVTVPDTYVYIDGAEIDVTEPQYVQYGTHSLVVQCDGYTSWNKTLVVNSESATITLAMESDTGATSADSDSTTEEETDSDSEASDEEGEASNYNTLDVDGENSESSEETEDYDYEVDYLSTISDLLSNLME